MELLNVPRLVSKLLRQVNAPQQNASRPNGAAAPAEPAPANNVDVQDNAEVEALL
ncbi:uncharacterized protein PSFLO_06898 [Pseudozyma flocculosa]|uniref:Uncharacterized protein n=1 Tax=Pseudozyma flocculosa TaxID=84751 RepID=A0A5C3FBB2_9BASI|nr:uncharacterized protein PSFLO_06898 [Pseudozyma flocculosa]